MGKQDEVTLVSTSKTTSKTAELCAAHFRVSPHPVCSQKRGEVAPKINNSGT